MYPVVSFLVELYAKTAYGNNLGQSVGLSCANLRRIFKIDLCDLSTGLLDVLVYGHAMRCSHPVSLSNSRVTADFTSGPPSLKYKIFFINLYFIITSLYIILETVKALTFFTALQIRYLEKSSRIENIAT